MLGVIVITTQDSSFVDDFHRLQGKILYELKEYQDSGKAYSAILRLQPKLLPAWKGLAELHTTTKNDIEAVGVYQSLVSMHVQNAPAECRCVIITLEIQTKCMPSDSSGYIREQGAQAGVSTQACIFTATSWADLRRCSGV